MDEYFENVIVGSGFGGSVAAYRLADNGGSVCVLERGKPYPPGSFARNPWEMAGNFWDPSAGHHGLFDVWSFRGLDAVVSAGLGGGSLIYANVLLRKPEKWFVKGDRFGDGTESWPITRADLDPHYDVVEQMLGAQRFPAGEAGFETVYRPAAMRDAAQALNLEYELPNQAVSFRPEIGAPAGVGLPLVPTPYPNLHGRPRTTCVLCGQCDIGCNTGSKNTLDHTYLSAAQHRGAEIRTRTEVRSFARDGDGYVVRYVYHAPENETGEPHDTRAPTHRTVRCRRLILAAGSLGTTFLLLRMRGRQALPGVSDTLGRRFSGNGDYMTVMKRAHEIDGGRLRPIHSSHGPVITSSIGVPDALDGGPGRGFNVQDCGYPMLLNWLVEARYGLPARALAFAAQRLWADITRNPKSQLGRSFNTLIGDGGTAASSMPLLGMGRDVPDGRLRLRSDRYLALDWTTKTSKDYYGLVRSTMRDMADRLHAERLNDSVWSYFRRSITSHPLGGVPMGVDAHDGVCDGLGEVFGFDNLFIADGSAMPGPVGVNPSLTIAAFSDRQSTAILDGRTRADRRTATVS